MISMYIANVEAEPDGNPWYHDIRMFLKNGSYPESGNSAIKLACCFFLNGEVLYKRLQDGVLLICVDVMSRIHEEQGGPHLSKFMLARKILRWGYYWLTMENVVSSMFVDVIYVTFRSKRLISHLVLCTIWLVISLFQCRESVQLACFIQKLPTYTKIFLWPSTILLNGWRPPHLKIWQRHKWPALSK